MAAQGERVSGVVGMCDNLDSMVQDGDPEQDWCAGTISLSQTNPEPEMGAAAAAEYGTPPPHLRQSPSPAPSKTATDNGGSVPLSPLLTQIVEAFAQVMKEEMKKMWGETRHVGQCLQADKMATPRAATNELEGSALAGEDRVLRATCRARKATEKVTQGEKLIG